ncbi:hypothetical protein BDY21DRAFT_152526 [Lineolata rhizophorae]|uniref:Uncharacterized protein n=1 Tax=Lineolata rhizophorae TaxID=578093 RepID=A0A6A6NNH8_9PEZI|nr:hypothetical protein BDY21DRAFT_152526 [Lineolata rhizophorae]
MRCHAAPYNAMSHEHVQGAFRGLHGAPPCQVTAAIKKFSGRASPTTKNQTGCDARSLRLPPNSGRCDEAPVADATSHLDRISNHAQIRHVLSGQCSISSGIVSPASSNGADSRATSEYSTAHTLHRCCQARATNREVDSDSIYLRREAYTPKDAYGNEAPRTINDINARRYDLRGIFALHLMRRRQS